MIHSSRFNLNPLSIWSRFLAVASVALACSVSPAVAQNTDTDEEEKPYIAIRAAEADSLTLAPTGDATLAMTRAPSSAADAKLLIVNSANFAIWEGPLQRNGANWTSKFDLDAAEALLTASAVLAEFPGAATGGKDLRISFVRDVLTQSLAASAALMGEEPIFYDAPTPPTPIEAIEDNPDPARVASYAMAARRYDEELATYRAQLIAAKASAKALWTDLKTAGKLNQWPAAVVNAQEGAYAKLEALQTEVTQKKMANRNEAKRIIDEWNAAHADAIPVELSFRDHSLKS